MLLHIPALAFWKEDVSIPQARFTPTVVMDVKVAISQRRKKGQKAN